MSLDSVRTFLTARAPDVAVIELDTSTATVAQAAQAHGVEPRQIAKTLSLRVGDRELILATRGDARLDNAKFKAAFGGKAKMLGPEEVEAVTGHPVVGVSPFGLTKPLPVYCDVSLQAFADVVPAAGSTTVRYGSRRNAWPTWSAPNGSTSASCPTLPRSLEHRR